MLQKPQRSLFSIHLVIILMLTAHQTSFAQTDDKYQWQVYTKPLSIADPTASTFPVGVEKQVTQRWILAADYGVKIASFIYAKESGFGRQNYHFSKTSLELKYLLLNKLDHSDKSGFFYFGLRGMYFPQRYRLYNGYYLKDGNEFTYDYSDLKRPTWLVSFISGREISGKHFVFTPYFGFGIRVITIRQQPHNLTPTSFSNPIDWDFSSHIDRYDGTHIRSNFAGGFALGYLLGK